MDLLPPERWRHVNGVDNPADCASRGVFPVELVKHRLWWSGPKWLQLPSAEWPSKSPSTVVDYCIQEVCHLSVPVTSSIIFLEQYSDYHHLKNGLFDLFDVVKGNAMLQPVYQQKNWYMLKSIGSGTPKKFVFPWRWRC